MGPGGCNNCIVTIMNDNATTADVCLHANETCPDGYFLEYTSVGISNRGSLNSNGPQAICRKCHPRCKKCTGYGFHSIICTECKKFIKGEQCEDECSTDHYPDVTTHECHACHEECRGCTGPGPENCIGCHNFKLFDEGWIDPNNTFK